MNGALGWFRGFMWPTGGDPPSEDPRLRAPLCVFVEFDDVRLGADQEGNELFSFSRRLGEAQMDSNLSAHRLCSF